MSELLTPRTPGAALRAAREKRRLSVAEIAETTRIKMHIVQALENDDYSVIAAPLYGKGFIKLYAEAVGLDPVPLVRQYLGNYARSIRPTLKTELPPPTPMNEDGVPQPSPVARFKESSGSMLTEMGNNLVTTLQDLLHTLMVAWLRLKARHRDSSGSLISSGREFVESTPFPVGKTAALVFAILVVAILAVSAYLLYPGSKPVAPVAAAAPQALPAKHSIYGKSLRLAEPPPAPYVKLK